MGCPLDGYGPKPQLVHVKTLCNTLYISCWYTKRHCILATRKSLRRCRHRHMPHPGFGPGGFWAKDSAATYLCQSSCPSLLSVKEGGISEHPMSARAIVEYPAALHGKGEKERSSLCHRESKPGGVEQREANQV